MATRQPGSMRIVLIGSGRLAHALARTMPERITALFGRNLQHLQSMKSIAAGSSLIQTLDTLRDIDCDAIWIATSDSEIERMCGEIAGVRESWEGVVAIHSSGSVPLEALEVFHQRGGGILALH